MVSNTRLYGASIAVASGVYSLASASTGSRMTTSGWVMALLGVVVLVHGIVLLTSYADRLGEGSGPLMIAYAIVMLLNQALLGTGTLDGGGMGMGQGMGGGMMPSGMGWDAGMVMLAALMLASGLIMTRDRQTPTGPGAM